MLRDSKERPYEDDQAVDQAGELVAAIVRDGDLDPTKVLMPGNKIHAAAQRILLSDETTRLDPGLRCSTVESR